MSITDYSKTSNQEVAKENVSSNQQSNFGFDSNNQAVVNNFVQQSNVLFQRYSVLDQSLTKLTEIISETIPEISTSNTVKLEVLPLSKRAQRNITYDTVLITASHKNSRYKAVYALILAKQEDIINKTQIKVPTTDGQVYTDQLDLYPTQLVNDEEAKDVIISRVRDVDSESDIIYAGGSVIFTDRNTINDRDSIVAVVINAAEATTNAIYRKGLRDGEQPKEINLAQVDPSYSIFVEKIASFDTVKDAHDNVVRSDFKFKVTSRNSYSQKNPSSLINGSETVDVAYSTGYLDFRRVSPDQAVNTTGWGNYSSDITTVRYLPSVVFTSLVPVQNQSVGNLLFTLATSVSAARDNGCWVIQNMLNQNRYPENWSNGVEGIGYEITASDENGGPLGPIDLRDGNKLQHFLAKYVVPETMYQLEVREGSPNEWIYKIFLQAATEDNPGSADSANQEIIRYANYITNGWFEKIYRERGGSGRVVHPLNNQVRPQGVYTHKTFGLRPLTDIDRFRILNSFNNGSVVDANSVIEMVNSYSQAVSLDNSTPAEYRLYILKNLYKNFNNGSIIYGYSRFITFEGNFLYALIDAIVRTGLKVTTNTQFNFVSNIVYDPRDVALNNAGATYFNGIQSSWDNNARYTNPFFNNKF